MTILNVLVVGEVNTGKSTFIDIHTNDDGTYNDMSISNVNDHEYKVKYFEFDDKEDKTKQYKDKDLILLCFAVNNVPSYNKLDEVYVKEAKEFGKGTPMMAIGTKCDLRDDPERDDMVSIEQGIEMAIKVGATAYLECSTTSNFNLDELQEEIVKVILLDKEAERNKTSNFSFGIVKFLLGR